jgi:hypothetical protein
MDKMQLTAFLLGISCGIGIAVIGGVILSYIDQYRCR